MRGLFIRRADIDEVADLARLIGELAARSPGFSAGPLKIHIVASPAAGLLRDRREVRENLARLRTILLSASRDVAPNPEAEVDVRVALHRGHPEEIARGIAGDMLRDSGAARPRLILTMGGDGTHLETLSPLLGLPEELRRRITVFRLPLGTGNDGADADSMTGAARIFLHGGAPTELSAVRVSPRNAEPFYAFNIVSLGIDAFVTRVTNLLKGRLPGDAYKLIADAATLVYEPLYGVRPMELEIHDDGAGPARIRGRYILAAFGVSGGRTYGNHKKILPGEENLCAIRTRSLPKKIALKPLLYSGLHTGAEGVDMRKAGAVTVYYNGRICLQTDGESRILKKRDFPCRMEVVRTGIRTLQGKT